MNNLYYFQRKTDKAVTQPLVLTMMMDHMVDDEGAIVSIARHLKTKYDYDNSFYALSKAERTALEKRIEAEAEQLRDTRSLMALGKMDEKGRFSIEGMDENNPSFIAFKGKVIATIKKVIGNAGRDDINGIRMGAYTSALMQFRSWIPEMVEDRFDGLKYDDEIQAWTYGRYNLFFRELMTRNLPQMARALIKTLTPGLSGKEEFIRFAKAKYLEIKAQELEKEREFTLTEAEFVDLYIGSMRAMVGEIVVLLGVLVLYMSLTAAGDDDKEPKSGVRKLMIRTAKKLRNEFLFYLNPMEITRSINSPLPVIGLSTDLLTFTSAFSGEVYGRVIGDEERVEKEKPGKYFYRLFPVTKEVLLLMASFDEEFRKEYGIRIDNYFYK